LVGILYILAEIVIGSTGLQFRYLLMEARDVYFFLSLMGFSLFFYRSKVLIFYFLYVGMIQKLIDIRSFRNLDTQHLQ